MLLGKKAGSQWSVCGLGVVVGQSLLCLTRREGTEEGAQGEGKSWARGLLVGGRVAQKVAWKWAGRSVDWQA
jgi:hypothetical protein